MIKTLILLVLAIAVFGAGSYWTYELYLRPHQALKEEKFLPTEPAPPDPTIPEFEKCVEIRKARRLLEARAAFEAFIEQNGQSSKIEEARDHLGEINSSIFLSPIRAPEKQEYIVKSGDVLNKVAVRLKTTPELIMRANGLSGSMLRIGQRLEVSPGEFTIIVNKRTKRVVLLNHGKFFKRYAILSLPVRHAAAASPGKKATPAPPAQKFAGKVTERMAWDAKGMRVTFADKGAVPVAHWIAFSVPGNTLYSEPEAGSGAVKKPPTGIGMAPEAVEELAALLRKGDPATIEQ